MGGIGRTLFGGPSKSKQTSTSTSSSGNYAYPAISSTFGPAMGYTTQAGSIVNSLLGLGGGGSSPAPTPAPSSYPSGGGGGAIITPNGSYMDGGESPGIQPGGGYSSGGGVGGARGWLDHILHGGGGTPVPGGGGTPLPGGTPTPTPVPGTGGTGNDQTSALENFSNSAGMQFLRDQGTKAIDADKSARGLLQSGSTGTALEKFGQGLASTYLNQYMQNLFEQQRIGLGAGGLVASAGAHSEGSGESSGKSEGEKKGILPTIIQGLAVAGV